MTDMLTLAGRLIESHDGDIRAALADVLRDENGLAPTRDALDVIMAVVESTNATDGSYDGLATPAASDYAADAMRILQSQFTPGWRR